MLNWLNRALRPFRLMDSALIAWSRIRFLDRCHPLPCLHWTRDGRFLGSLAKKPMPPIQQRRPNRVMSLERDAGVMDGCHFRRFEVAFEVSLVTQPALRHQIDWIPAEAAAP